MRAPDDEQAWVGVYRYLEKIASEVFCLEETVDPDDKGRGELTIGMFLNRAEEDTFSKARGRDDNILVERSLEDVAGASVRGGCVHVSPRPGEEVDSVVPHAVPPLVVAGGSPMGSGTGVHRVICRIFCPMPRQGLWDSFRGGEANSFGSVGIVLRTDGGAGAASSWARRVDVNNGWGKKFGIVGMRYDADAQELIVHSNSHTRSSRYASVRHALQGDGTAAARGGQLHFAAELSTKLQTLLTTRYCDEEEWRRFMERTTEGNSDALAAWRVWRVQGAWEAAVHHGNQRREALAQRQEQARAAHQRDPLWGPGPNGHRCRAPHDVDAFGDGGQRAVRQRMLDPAARIARRR